MKVISYLLTLITLQASSQAFADACTVDLHTTLQGGSVTLHLAGDAVCLGRLAGAPEGGAVEGYLKFDNTSERLPVTGQVISTDGDDVYSLSSPGYKFELNNEECVDAPSLVGHYTHDGTQNNITFHTMAVVTAHEAPSGIAYTVVSNADTRSIRVGNHSVDDRGGCDSTLTVYDVTREVVSGVDLYKVEYEIDVRASGVISGLVEAYIHQGGEMLYGGVSGDKFGYVGEWYNYSASACGISLKEDIVTRECLSSRERTVGDQLSIVEDKEITRYQVGENGFIQLSVERYKREGLIEPEQPPSIDERGWVAY